MSNASILALVLYLITNIARAETSVSSYKTSATLSSSGVLSSAATSLNPSFASPSAPLASNIFVPVDTDAPPPDIPTYSSHPIPRLGIENATYPLETNKFYANFFLGNQDSNTWTQPYAVLWERGHPSWGLAVSHFPRSKLEFTPKDQTPAGMFTGHTTTHSVVLSAQELGSSSSLSTSSLTGFSVNVNLRADGKTLIQFPLVQGMGFVTGIYFGATPQLSTLLSFSSLDPIGFTDSKNLTYKYRITFTSNTYDASSWLLYVTPDASASSFQPRNFALSGTKITGPVNFQGLMQVAKAPLNAVDEATYDASAGTYARGASISASVDRTVNTGTYTISWDKGGDISKKLVMFALPHHVQSFSDATFRGISNIKLDTTTKGVATAVVGDSFAFVETISTGLGFAPYDPVRGSVQSVSLAAKAAIRSAAEEELKQDIDKVSTGDSYYGSGKSLAKFAMLIYATNDIVGDSSLAAPGLVKLKNSFARFVNNTRIINPLVYDKSWKGVVSSVSYSNGKCGADYGNTCYADHHFHFGYFVYTAAVIAYLDPSWLSQQGGRNKAWVNVLVRDYANSIASDPYFPFSRSFDWFHGHSWAAGVKQAVGDGKDEESTSEDAFSIYALKMWGKVIGDLNMEARGDLQLAIAARSFQHYFLLQSDNQDQPARYIGNKVAGILHENKVEHATYFGSKPEWIEGIHMIPLNPSSSITRKAAFVQEEWQTYFSNGRVDAIDDKWKGILYANLALIDPTASYNFFASPGFKSQWLDGGASKTWYLTFAACLGRL